jgi:integration host factor subunit beta
MKSFTREALAKRLSQQLHIDRASAQRIVDTTLVAIAEVLVKGQRVEFRHFGVFEPVVRKPKIGRNPRKPSEAQYHIPARCDIRFRTGKTLLNQLNA